MSPETTVGRKTWLGPALVTAAGYAVIGAFPAWATRAGVPPSTQFWRYTAWGLSSVLFAAHIWFESTRPQPRKSAALHPTVAVMIATALLAASAIVHNLGRGPMRPMMWLAFVIWPVLTGIGSFLVALLVLAVLRTRQSTAT